MSNFEHITISRRQALAGAAAASLLALPGCSSLGGFSLVDAIKRLLNLSSQNAFAKLTAPGGFWDSSVARFDVPDVFGGSGSLLKSVLTSGVFRDQLQHQLNLVAEKGAERAAPLVAEAVRNVSVPDALGIIRGGPTAATSYLRSQMGPALVNGMVPGLSDALRLSGNPIIGQAIAAVSGVDIGQIAQSVSTKVDNSIWSQIGVEETAIRAHPESTNDPVLIGVFKVV